jgi:hypothetical protein
MVPDRPEPVQRNTIVGHAKSGPRRRFETGQKRAANEGGSSDNREASNRVDRSHSTSRSWTNYVMKGKA